MARSRLLAVVSGAAGGIGTAITARLCDDGVAVLALDCDAHQLKVLAKACECTTLCGDVRSEQFVDEVREVTGELGGADVFIGAAGAYPRRSLRELTPALFREGLDLNFVAHYALVRALCVDAPRPLSAIVFLGSVLARAGRRDLAEYVSAKAALEGLTRALARELGGQGTRVNCVAPGSIAVEKERLVVPDADAAARRQLARQAIARRGLPSDVAGVVAFLIGPDSEFITGQTVTVDGGWQLV